MCGIFAVLNYDAEITAYRQRALDLSKKLRHRGPDWTGAVIAGNNILCHERLSIVGVESGAQPLTNVDGTVILSVNGEIYNHRILRKNLKSDAVFKTQSDCEIILHLYNEIGSDVVKQLDGMFSFVLLDTGKNRFIAARDPIGITTLYQGSSSQHPGTVYFASELKALNEECDRIWAFPPGHFYDSETGKTVRYFNPKWWDPTVVPTTKPDLKAIRHGLEQAVRKRLMAEVPYGVLLSGGLDSSLVASIAAREIAKATKRAWESQVDSSTEEKASSETEVSSMFAQLHSFAIGLVGSPDLEAARKAAKYLNTMHHEYTFTLQEGLDAVADVIYHLETYDVTTIRASTPMYLLSRKIKAMGVKMVLSGEGSDEIFGGYLYFHAAPSAKALHEETVTRVRNLHTSDCLRANKSTMAWGLEARVPFLDREFLDIAMSVDPSSKLFSGLHIGAAKIEKNLLRRAFDTSPGGGAEGETPYLPDSILWRQKEQFSDGVGYGWIDALRDSAEAKVTGDQWEKREIRWPKDTPQTKEAYVYREVFERHFPQPACVESVVRWIPRGDWGCPSDPSGRAQKVHTAAYQKSEL